MTVTQVHFQEQSMVDYYRGGPTAAFSNIHRAQYSASAAYIQPQTSTFTRHSPRQSTILQPSASHSRTRTSSSSALPPTEPLPSPPLTLQQAQQQYPAKDQSRRASITTFSTTASNTSHFNMQRQGTNSSAESARRRSTSSRSSTTPTSYVALMRKQKATVWCDRAQNIDQKTAAAQRAAKQRAVLEVHGGNAAAGRTNTINSGSMVGKIRHHGVPKAPGYVPANLSGAGVPMRLSANEMLGDEEEGRSIGETNSSMMHARSGSGRSSTNSAKYPSGYPRSQGRFSTGSTPPSGGESGSPNENIPELAETPGAGRGDQKRDYFNEKTDGSTLVDPSLVEGEDSFGDIKDMKGPNTALQAVQKAKNNEDLQRRGSVDERAMSMSKGVRLFVANPDLDDD
jgi:hypothetical protein